MQTLCEAEILALINAGKTFQAELNDGSLVLCVQEYTPHIGTAIHAGHRLPPNLVERCLLTESERLLEEDPYTDQLIAPFPMTLVAKDSRYEYDLNRSEAECLYEVAWGKPVWQEGLAAYQKKLGLEKHRRYYRILHALIEACHSRFGNCLVIDVHSYNWKIRQYKEAPVFNIGTAQIDKERWGKLINSFELILDAIELPDIDVSAKCDSVFYGKGYQATYVKRYFPNALTIPLEVKKIFMDEVSAKRFPRVIDHLQRGLHYAVQELVSRFIHDIEQENLRLAALTSSKAEIVEVKTDRPLH